ncbi:hypothetical protein EDEG_01555 [Edhazardia aedis USNM 41457]|uniref:Transmembrane protein n=1 Tax=Edhazardia aedis (strain USNM 41457) TaxID=1003232 RepID=J9D8S4_EDHAE|nr:hypothetical protein EDEG_01555 [Edhazardia aedis USNM 41457]|eukprot:EJW04151.1 hypothetical protein EDEG_01555 [Edhazardia aedis USNM 41457]
MLEQRNKDTKHPEEGQRMNQPIRNNPGSQSLLLIYKHSLLNSRAFYISLYFHTASMYHHRCTASGFVKRCFKMLFMHVFIIKYRKIQKFWTLICISKKSIFVMFFLALRTRKIYKKKTRTYFFDTSCKYLNPFEPKKRNITSFV